MHLALAPRRRIATLDPANAADTLAALDAALAARSAAGLPTLAYDPAEGLPDLAVAPAALAAPALVAQLRLAAEAIRTRGGIIESLWIVGGPNVVPFASLPNPMADRDGPLLTDSPYGLADLNAPLARWPVGRTPDSGAGTLAARLRRVATAHAAGPRPAGNVLVVAAARWAAVSGTIAAGAGAALLLAPPITAGSPELAALEGFPMIACNLHGVRTGDSWYGQRPGDSELIPALAPADLATRSLDGAVLISQACFGARLAPVERGPSLAVAALDAGARGVYAANGLTYGAPDPPPGESDLLVAGLLAQLRQPDARLGSALLAAQAAMLRQLLAQGGPQPDDLKTLLGFLLYGDPLLPA